MHTLGIVHSLICVCVCLLFMKLITLFIIHQRTFQSGRNDEKCQNIFSY